MPREQKIPPGTSIDPDSVFDAFSITQDRKPAALEPAGQGGSVPTEEAAPRSLPAKRKPKAAPEKPVINRVGRKRTGRNIPFSQAVTAETANNYYAVREQLGIPMGAVMELAINALMEKLKKS